MDEVQGVEVVPSPKREHLQDICEQMCSWERYCALLCDWEGELP